MTSTKAVQFVLEKDKESDDELLFLNTSYQWMEVRDTPVGEENTEKRLELIKDYLIDFDGDVDAEEVFDDVFQKQYDETEGFKDIQIPFIARKGDFATTEIVEFDFETYKESEDLDGCFEYLLDEKRNEIFAADDIDSLIEVTGSNFGYETHEDAVIKHLRRKTLEEFGRMFAVKIYPRRYCSGRIVNEGKDFEYEDYGDSTFPEEYIFFNQCLWKLDDFETFILNDVEETIEIKNKIINSPEGLVSPLYKRSIQKDVGQGGVIESTTDGKIEISQYLTDKNQNPKTKNTTTYDLKEKTAILQSFDIQNDELLWEMNLSDEELEEAN